MPSNLGVVASIVINLHADGQMSISGNIGDVDLALQMLDHARDAVKSQLKRKDEIVIPGRDVVTYHDPNFPVRPRGDMDPRDWGDTA